MEVRAFYMRFIGGGFIGCAGFTGRGWAKCAEAAAAAAAAAAGAKEKVKEDGGGGAGAGA
ncbi:hypothetical protein RUM43_014877, partial [Polyplax serrata]